MPVTLRSITQTILLIIFAVTATFGMLLIASYPEPYQITIPWQPEATLQIPQQLAYPLLTVAIITLFLIGFTAPSKKLS